jgi:hypothetical protein
MIVCGWCGRATSEGDRCVMCHHEDPARPYVQRRLDVPRLDAHDGRPTLVPADVARRLATARRQLEEAGRTVTIEALAEVLEVSPRTVRRWREVAG